MPCLAKCENELIVTPTSPYVEGLIGRIKNFELNCPITVKDVSECLKKLDLDVDCGNVKKCRKMDEKLGFFGQKTYVWADEQTTNTSKY